MKMDWQPTQEGLEQILQLLRQSQSTDVQTQNHVQQRLEELNQYPDFNNYLVFVLSKMRTEGNVGLGLMFWELSYLTFFSCN